MKVSEVTELNLRRRGGTTNPQPPSPVAWPDELIVQEASAQTPWGYDVRPGIDSPPRLLNQMAVRIAQDRDSDVVELARLLALVKIAMADAAISCWESKYHYNFWRAGCGHPRGRCRDEPDGPGGW